MEKKETKNRKGRSLLRQFIKFGFVGIGNTAVSMATYYIFLWWAPNLYMLGSILGAILSIFHAFLWSNYYVFPQKNQKLEGFLFSLMKCYLSYGGTAVLSNFLLWFEVEHLNFGKAYSPLFNLIVTIPLNYVLNKVWVFGQKRKG